MRILSSWFQGSAGGAFEVHGGQPVGAAVESYDEGGRADGESGNLPGGGGSCPGL